MPLVALASTIDRSYRGEQAALRTVEAIAIDVLPHEESATDVRESRATIDFYHQIQKGSASTTRRVC